MSEIHLRYMTLRAQGLGHYGALDEIALQTGIDRGTIERIVNKEQASTRVGEACA